MFLPFDAAAPTSEPFARRLDIPISAVPSMIAAMPVVDPSAAMSKVVPGCSALKCSASCGTNFAPSVSEPLITRRSALASVNPNATARRRIKWVDFILVADCWENWMLESDVQIGEEELILVKRINADRDRRSTGPEAVINAPAVVVGEVNRHR